MWHNVECYKNKIMRLLGVFTIVLFFVSFNAFAQSSQCKITYHETEVFGGSKGSAFQFRPAGSAVDDYYVLNNLRLSKIQLAYHDAIDAINLVWADERGNEMPSNYEYNWPCCPGGGDGGAKKVDINLAEDEYVTQIKVWFWSDAIRSIAIHTNKRSKPYKFGISGGTERRVIFTRDNPLISIFGRAGHGNLVNQLGFVTKRCM